MKLNIQKTLMQKLKKERATTPDSTFSFPIADAGVDFIFKKVNLSITNKKLIKKAIPDTAVFTVDAAHVGANPVTVKADKPPVTFNDDVTIKENKPYMFGDKDDSGNEEPDQPAPDVHSTVILERNKHIRNNISPSANKKKRKMNNHIEAGIQ
jgi:hypothetical protein